jgi:hypothetical protein
MSSSSNTNASGSNASGAATAAGMGGAGKARTSEMSYKFQRLREKLRAAIAAGELAGKLPGERALAKRFHVNAKTLSKALTDLAAEGVLDRSIGRGTYVKGSAPVGGSAAGRWLLLCDPDDADALILLEHLRRANPDTQSTCEGAAMRPSALSAFSAVVDAAAATPEAFLRDLVVRNMNVVAVGREARMYSMHAVLVDAALGGARVARDLLLAGHRKLAVVEARGSSVLAAAVRQTAARLAPEGAAAVDAFSPEDAARLGDGGATAIVCDSAATARRVRTALARQAEAGATAPGLESAASPLPAGVALAAVGIAWADVPCGGYFVDGARIAEQVVSLLRDPPAGRPATLWMAGEPADHGTITVGSGAAPVERGAATLSAAARGLLV